MAAVVIGGLYLVADSKLTLLPGLINLKDAQAA
jgi:hypothetical protein